MGWTSFECRLCGGPGRKGQNGTGEIVIEHDCRETLRVPCHELIHGAPFADVKPLCFFRIVGQDFFVHKGPGIAGNLYVLTEYTSGRKIEMGEGLAVMLSHGVGRLEKMGQQGVLRKITAAILETGIVNQPLRLRSDEESKVPA